MAVRISEIYHCMVGSQNKSGQWYFRRWRKYGLVVPIGVRIFDDALLCVFADFECLSCLHFAV